MSERQTYSRFNNVLPGELTWEDVVSARQFLEAKSPDDLCFWANQRSREPYSYNDQRFRMVVDKPFGGDSGKAVLVPSEFGTKDLPRLIAKSRVIRDMVDPEATLIIQPSSVIGEDNMNFSYDERLELLEGNLQPYIGRIAVVMARLGNPKDLTVFGPSQGGMVGGMYAASVEGPVALVMAEAPNIVERSGWQLASDFLSSGRDLSDVVSANFANHQAPFAIRAERDSSSARSMAKFGFLSLHPDNIATAGAMRYNSAASCINVVLKNGGSVVHAWGDQDNSSPAAANERIEAEFRSNPRYASRVLHGMSHAAMDFYALDGALARLAHNLKPIY